MTRPEALERLATGVMGWNVYTEAYWRNLTEEQCQEKCASVVLIATEIGSLCFGQPAGWGNEYDPFTNPVQALELAEAWCRRKPEERTFMYSYVPPRPGYNGQHQVHLMQYLIDEDGNCCPSSIYTNDEQSLAKPIYDAVCEAEGIEVDG